MRKVLFVSMLVITVALGSSTLYAASQHSDEVDLTRKVIQAQRRLAIFRVLDLTESEKSKFWPVYDAYVGDMQQVNDRMVALIKEYAENFKDVSNEKAIEMLNELLAIDSDKITVKKEYVKKVQRVLPGVKVARFFQAENKLDAQRDLSLAAQIPLVGGTE